MNELLSYRELLNKKTEQKNMVISREKRIGEDGNWQNNLTKKVKRKSEEKK
jgi:hypothetical protein